MIFNRRTKLNCAEIEERIEEDAESYGQILKKHFPFSINLPDSGFEIKEHTSVFELCKPSIAANLLNIQPELNILMSCRISAYQKGGISFASTPDLKAQLEMLDCDEALKSEIVDLYIRIRLQ